MTKEEQSSSENLNWDVSSAAISTANWKQSLEMGLLFDLSSQGVDELPGGLLRSFGLWEMAPSSQGGGTQVSLSHWYINRLFSLGWCRSRLNVQGKQVYFMGSYTKHIHYHWNVKDSEGIALLKNRVRGMFMIGILKWERKTQRTQSSLMWSSQGLQHMQGWALGVSWSCPWIQPPGCATRMREDT